MRIRKLMSIVSVALALAVAVGPHAASAQETQAKAALCGHYCDQTYGDYSWLHTVYGFAYGQFGYYPPDESGGGWYFWSCDSHPYGCGSSEAENMPAALSALEEALNSRNTGGVTKALDRLGGNLVINSERSAIQVRACQGESIIAHIPIDKGILSSIAVQFADHVVATDLKLAVR